jgi:hypothetical protein
MIVIIMAFWLICALSCMMIAQSKGHSSGLWLIIGLIFGIFGVIAALFCDDKSADGSGK